MITSWSVGGGLQPSGSDGMLVGVGPPPVAGRCWRHHRGESRTEDDRQPRSTGRANTALPLTRGAALRAQPNATVRQCFRKEKALYRGSSRKEPCLTWKGICMIRLTYVLRRLPSLSRAEFQQYWRNTHGPLIAKHATTLA